MGKARDSKFELLRIFSIFLIILSHFSYYGLQPRLRAGISLLNYLGIRLFLPYGEIGVAIFILITGYFIGDKEFTFKDGFKKTSQVWLETIFYSVLIFVLCIFFARGYIKLTLGSFVRSFLPFSFSEYWFVTAYIMLMILVPFLNILTKFLDKKQFSLLLIVTIIFCDVLPNNIASSSWGLGEIIASYLVGSYVKMYDLKINFKKIIIFIVLIFMYVGGFLVSYAKGFDYSLQFINGGIFPLIIATELFLIIKKQKPFHNFYINKLASTVFAGYLITEHEFIREIIWKLLAFKNVDNVWIADFSGFIGIILILFIGVFTVDLIRQYLFKILKINLLKDEIEDKIFRTLFS